MKYHHMVRAEFVDRPNRFVAHVKLTDGEGQEALLETVHVKNTGRCGELLLPGVEVWLEKSDNPARSTAYDLVAVKKGKRMINMDSQAPNKAVGEWLLKKELFPDLVCVRPETTFGKSRFDFYIETESEKIFLEVKGVTREQDDVVCFPDAPSLRAIKHVEELVEAKRQGYRACILFVIQMEDVKYFTPDVERHAAFAESLKMAAANGVEIYAYDCKVTPESMEIHQAVPVSLTGEEPAEKGSRNQMTGSGLAGRAESEELLGQISQPLLEWYDRKRRILPWREIPTPYRVWVSEIMLQQTRVEAVKPYFERFMKELPDISALANAQEETLLKLWEGLGYYNRVRNLQQAALQIMEQHGGQMPADYEEILKLKGIGSYTAGAISSIAFGIPRPAVDGNVLRVLSRIREDNRLISDAKVKALVEQELEKVMPVDRPGDFNQGMMELGACVCIPNGAPHCGECPLQEICRAHGAGTEMEYPRKEGKKERTIEQKTILIIRDQEKVALRRRPAQGLLAGMYEFPSLEGFREQEEVIRYLGENGLKMVRITPLPDAKHIFTHREWHMKGYLVRVDELEPAAPTKEMEDWIYIEPLETKDRFPIPSAFGVYADYLQMKRGIQNPEEG